MPLGVGSTLQKRNDLIDEIGAIEQFRLMRGRFVDDGVRRDACDPERKVGIGHVLHEGLQHLQRLVAAATLVTQRNPYRSRQLRIDRSMNRGRNAMLINHRDDKQGQRSRSERCSETCGSAFDSISRV